MLERVDNSWSSSDEEEAEESRQSRAGPSGGEQRRKTACTRLAKMWLEFFASFQRAGLVSDQDLVKVRLH